MASSPTQSHDERDDKLAIDEKHHGETLASDREKTLQFDSPEEYKQALNRVRVHLMFEKKSQLISFTGVLEDCA